MQICQRFSLHNLGANYHTIESHFGSLDFYHGFAKFFKKETSVEYSCKYQLPVQIFGVFRAPIGMCKQCNRR